MGLHIQAKRSQTKLVVITLLLLIAGAAHQTCLAAARNEIEIPDIPGYRTLKCDFHIHTVFSDGAVWPTVRVEEAWQEGLDAIAITDHIEYSPHKNDVRPSCDRPYEIARPAAQDKGLILIRGAEITRDMPPGHLNAIFLKDASRLDVNDWRDAVKAAIDQNAFVFWNHPGWIEQAPNEVPVWYPQHTELLEKGWLHGIEAVNEYSYYPLVKKWGLEKDLTLLGNSDVHDPICLAYDQCSGEHRTMTLVFAKEKTEQSIKEALFAKRTAIYHKNLLIGRAQYLKPIFDQSVRIINPQVTLRGQGMVNLMVNNRSQIDFELVTDKALNEIYTPRRVTLARDRTVMVGITAKKGAAGGTKEIRIPYTVKNLLVESDEGLHIELPVTVTIIPSEAK
jgi:hypothetical protein